MNVFHVETHSFTVMNDVKHQNKVKQISKDVMAIHKIMIASLGMLFYNKESTLLSVYSLGQSGHLD